MKSIIVEHQQGTKEWHHHRATHLNASELAAAMGLSNYKSRSDLIKERATGLIAEIDDATLARFAKGHEFEATARPWAEEIIGSELYPIVLAADIEGLSLSASLDGQNMLGDVIWEHKTGSAFLIESLENGVIPPEYHPQIEQQMMLSDAKRCLFMASKGTRETERHVWYVSDSDLRAKIIPTWRQFLDEVSSYQHIEHIEKPEATPVIGLPALFAQVEGKFNLSTNIVSFASELKAFVGRMDLSPTDDQGFADLEAQVKVCVQAEESIKAQVLGARGQMVSFDEFCKTADLLLAIASRARIDGTNAIKEKKSAIKEKAIADAKALFAAHVVGLEAEITPLRLVVAQPDFIAATKGLRGLKSLHNEIDTALANGKIAADVVAKDIRAKLKWHEANFAHRFLFNDLAQIITKPFDDFTLTVKSRIAEHQQAEAAKEEEAKARAKVEAEALAKAKAEQEAIAAADRAKVEAELASKPIFGAEQAQIELNATAIEEKRKQAQLSDQSTPFTKPQVVQVFKPIPPTSKQIIECVAEKFNVTYGQACDWIMAASEIMKDAA